MASRPRTSGRSTTTWRSNRSGPQEGRVEDLGAVGGRHDDEALAGVEAVHLGEELVEGLLALVVAGHDAHAARLADGVELVDEDDARGLGLRLLEEIAHARRADADEHLDEVGAGELEEGHLGLAGHRAREEGLAGAGRADEKHALGDLAAQAPELLGPGEVIDDLAQLLGRLLDPGHVGEGDAGLLADQLGLRLADRHHAGARLHAAQDPAPEQHHAAEEDQPGQDGRPQPAPALVRIGDLVLVEELLELLGVAAAGDQDGAVALLRRLDVRAHLGGADDDFLDLAGRDLLLELVVVDLVARRRELRDQRESEHGQRDVDQPGRAGLAGLLEPALSIHIGQDMRGETVCEGSVEDAWYRPRPVRRKARLLLFDSNGWR
jgi:hypothetical protein